MGIEWVFVAWTCLWTLDSIGTSIARLVPYELKVFDNFVDYVEKVIFGLLGKELVDWSKLIVGNYWQEKSKRQYRDKLYKVLEEDKGCTKLYLDWTLFWLDVLEVEKFVLASAEKVELGKWLGIIGVLWIGDNTTKTNV